MPEVSGLQWLGALGVTGIMAWVALDAFTAWWPWRLLDPTHPKRKMIGSVILLALGITTYPLYKILINFIWTGIKHIAGLDIPELVD